MDIKCLSFGMFGSNCYIVSSQGEALIVDAGVDADSVIRELSKMNCQLRSILLTHGHLDHICSAESLRKQTGALLMIHQADSEMLGDPVLNGSVLFGMEPIVCAPPDKLLEEGDELGMGDLVVKVLHTPGHTQGGVCFLIGDSLFTGDTLFRHTIGRADLPGGNLAQLVQSIQTKLMTLDETISVYPGHEGATTIGMEKKRNPWLR